jgi:hypothetical protein
MRSTIILAAARAVFYWAAALKGIYVSGQAVHRPLHPPAALRSCTTARTSPTAKVLTSLLLFEEAPMEGSGSGVFGAVFGSRWKAPPCCDD